MIWLTGRAQNTPALHVPVPVSALALLKVTYKLTASTNLKYFWESIKNVGR